MLLVGLDGLDHGLFEEMARGGRMPRLEALRAQGRADVLLAPPPAAPVPSWATILTGVGPGRHGLFDFMHRDGYRLRFAGSEVREAPNVFEMLSAAGRSVVAVGFPTTHPPLEVEGAIVAGPDSPAAVRSRRGGCHPSELHDMLVGRFGEDYLPFDVPGPLGSTSSGPSWTRDALARLAETIGRRIEVTLFVADRVADLRPDLAAVHFPEAGIAGRRFWHLHDLNSPRRPEWIDDFLDESTGRIADPLARVYSQLDSAVGELVDRLAPGFVVVVSGHGMCGSGTRLASLNRFLVDEGFLHLERDAGVAAGDVLGLFKRIGLEMVPAELREELLTGVGSTVAAEIVSRIRLGSIEWGRTAAFSEDLDDAPCVHLNEMGREPEGLVHRSERTWWLRLVVDALEGWRAPGAPGQVPPGPRPVVEKVHLREDLYRGPHVDRLPSLIVELADDDGYGLSLHPGRFRTMRSPVEPLPEELLEDSPVRSQPGRPGPRGVLVAAATGSASARMDALGPVTQETVAPLVLELAGFRVPGYFDVEPGRVTDGELEWLDRRTLHEAFREARARLRTRPGARDEEGEQAVRKRLEDLGYL